MLWTDDEMKAAIESYFQMMKYEKDRTPYVKSEINRQTQVHLPNRTHKGIEYRWQNISSVLNDHGHSWLTGFKPANHVGANAKERIWKIIRDLNVLDNN